MGTKEAVWSQEDLKHLLNTMKISIPASEINSIYSRTQKTLDWKKIAFSKYSPEECQAKWKQMFDKLRKQRTMTDLIEEAESAINDPFRPKMHKIHPELPRKPAIPHSLYLKENKEVFKKKHPDLDPQKLMALVNASYKKLPAHVKAEYVKKYKLSREQYEQDLIQLRQQYGKPAQKKKGLYSTLKRKMEEQDDLDSATLIQPTMSSPPSKQRKDVELPDKPPLNGFLLFVDEQRAVSEPMAPKDHLRACGQRWKTLRQAERDEYNTRSKELKQEYGVKLNTFLSCLTEEKKEILKGDLEMLFRDAKKYSKPTPLMFPGEPKKPSWTGASVFFREKMLHPSGELRNPRDKFASITSSWASLSKEDKASFCKKAKIKFQRYTLDLQEWFRTLSVDDQADYLNRKPRQEKYVVTWDVEQPIKTERYMASDSEDEDYLYCHRHNHPEVGDDYDGGDDDDEEEEENEEVLWAHEKFAKPAPDKAAVDTSDTSDSDTR